MLAPVVLFVYNREEHTRMTLEALKKNALAGESKLFIFSDGARTEKDAVKVEKVRKLLKNCQEENVFREVVVTEAERNQGLAASVITGVTKVISEYGKAIVLEDDIVTAPDFLSYMNQALEYYEKDSRIWSVSGYTMPLESLQKYKKDVFLSYRASSWGWGRWKDRWELIDWEISDFPEFRKDKKRIRMFCRGGKDLYPMLIRQQAGELDSWAVRWCYWQSKCNMLTVYPKDSLVQNIGCDGSGTHEGNADIFSSGISEKEKKIFQFSGIELNKKIIREFYNIYSATLWFRIKNKVRKLVKV